MWVRCAVRASTLHCSVAHKPLLNRPDERYSEVHLIARTWQAGTVAHRPGTRAKVSPSKMSCRPVLKNAGQMPTFSDPFSKIKILDYQKFQISNNNPNHLNSPSCHAQAHRLWSCCNISRFSLFWKTQHLGTFSSTPVPVQCIQRDAPLLQISTQPIRSLYNHSVDAIYRQLWGWQKKA